MPRLQIAPGPWDAAGRKAAKAAAFLVGVLLVAGGLRMGSALIGAVEEGQPITMWSTMLVLAPLGLGGAAIFPGIITPIIYKLISAFGKDSE